MFCDQCGYTNTDNARFCIQCGRSFGQPASMPANVAGVQPTPQVIDPADQRTDGKAIGSLVLGTFSLLFFWIFAGIFAGIPAVILGHVSRSTIKKSLGRLKGDSMALTGLIMGYLSLAALPFVLIIAAIAIPNLLRARMAANEASAVASVRTIVRASLTYKTEHPSEGYPGSLQTLASPSVRYIDAQLGNGMKSGYHFVYEVRNTGAPEETGFFVRALPNNPNNTGTREFCAGQDGVVHLTRSPEPCTLQSGTL